VVLPLPLLSVSSLSLSSSNPFFRRIGQTRTGTWISHKDCLPDFNRSNMLRVNRQVQQVYITTESLRTRSSSNNEVIIRQTQNIEDLMRQHLERQYRGEKTLRGIQDVSSRATIGTSSKEHDLNSTISSCHPSPADSKIFALTPDHAITSSRVTQVSLRYSRRCTTICDCSCHKQRRLGTPNWANQLLGSLFIDYTGFPAFSPRCDAASCQYPSSSATQVTYTFPWWFLNCVLAATIAYSQPEGPELCLRIVRVCAPKSDIFKTASWKDVTKLKGLLSANKASVLDVEHGSNMTALHVNTRLPREDVYLLILSLRSVCCNISELCTCRHSTT